MFEALVIRLVSLAANLPPLQAVQLPNGDVGVTLRSLCRILQLDYLGQQQRIIRSHNLRGALTTVTVATKGGPQEAAVLLAWAIPLWVTSIQASRLTAAKRATVLILQHEAVPALYRAFQQAFAPTPEAPPQPAPRIAAPDPLEARFAALETDLREERAKRIAIETMLHDEAAKRAALARRLARTEMLLAAAIERLIRPGGSPEPLPETQPPRRRGGRPRRKR